MIKASAFSRARHLNRWIAFALALAMVVGGFLDLGMPFLRTTPVSAAPPPGFVEEVVVPGLAGPTALAFLPDNRLLITTQSGGVYIWNEGGSSALQVGSIAVCANAGSERGLLGVAVDPSFATNRFVYFYYTLASACTNRVSRFILSPANQLSGETVLLDKIPSVAGNHNGGDVKFGKDGYLYVSVGDSGCDYANNSGCGGSNDAARDLNSLVGKILRITRDGDIPADNPFVATTNSTRCNQGNALPNQVCREAYAIGFRNPFRIAMDPNKTTTRFFVNDVGQDGYEEIDEGTMGADYGWNCYEGTHANNAACTSAPNLTDPIYEYSHTSGCAAITGGAFVPNGAWPAGFNGAYLYSDYSCGTIFMLKPVNSETYGSSTFMTGLGNNSAVTLLFGPAPGGQALYFTSYVNGGQVSRIRFGSAQPTPTQGAATAVPTATQAATSVPATSTAGPATATQISATNTTVANATNTNVPATSTRAATVTPGGPATATSTPVSIDFTNTPVPPTSTPLPGPVPDILGVSDGQTVHGRVVIEASFSSNVVPQIQRVFFELFGPRSTIWTEINPRFFFLGGNTPEDAIGLETQEGYPDGTYTLRITTITKEGHESMTQVSFTVDNTNQPTLTATSNLPTNTPAPATATSVAPTETAVATTATAETTETTVAETVTATSEATAGTAIPTGTAPAATATTQPFGPDLVVESMAIELETGNACYTSTALGVRVTVANTGPNNAVSFLVDVNGVTKRIRGLDAGARINVWLPGSPTGLVTATVDSTNLVNESNETNNTLAQMLAVPTLTLPCTATPTGATPSATVIATLTSTTVVSATTTTQPTVTATPGEATATPSEPTATGSPVTATRTPGEPTVTDEPGTETATTLPETATTLPETATATLVVSETATIRPTILPTGTSEVPTTTSEPNDPTATSEVTGTPAESETPEGTPQTSKTPKPTRTVKPTRTPKVTQTPALGSACSVSYMNVATQKPRGNRPGFFMALVTLVNVGDPINTWTLRWNYSGQQRAIYSWNARVSQEGDLVTLRNRRNDEIDSGDSRFIWVFGSYRGDNPEPETFTMNGIECSPLP